MSKTTKPIKKIKIGITKFFIGITKLKIIMIFPIKNKENRG